MKKSGIQTAWIKWLGNMYFQISAVVWKTISNTWIIDCFNKINIYTFRLIQLLKYSVRLGLLCQYLVTFCRMLAVHLFSSDPRNYAVLYRFPTCPHLRVFTSLVGLVSSTMGIPTSRVTVAYFQVHYCVCYPGYPA